MSFTKKHAIRDLKAPQVAQDIDDNFDTIFKALRILNDSTGSTQILGIDGANGLTIVGPSGDDGEEGPQGPPGPQGTAGATGAAGNQGLDRIVETGETRTIANTYSAVALDYFAVAGTGVLALEGDAMLGIIGTGGGTTGSSISSVLLNNTGLTIYDTDSSHYLTISPGSNLTAHRSLSLVTGDANRIITLSGNPTLDDWFNQAVKTTSNPTFGNITSGTINGQTVSSSASFTGVLSVTGLLTANGGISVDAGIFSVADTTGNVVCGTLTSGLINGQTISSAANFTGSLAITGALSGVSTITTSSTINSQTISSAANFTGTVTTADDIKIPATKKLYLDGGSDTYIYENAANSMSFYCGAVNPLTLTTTAFLIGVATITSSSLSATATTLNSPGCYYDTTGSAANVYVHTDGYMRRSTSSLRYKTDIKRIDNNSIIKVLSNLHSITYRGTCKNDANRRFAGFIAEEVAEIEPLLVTFDADGITPNYVTYDRISAYLVSGWQQHQMEIDNLRTEIELLKMRNQQ